ncbi:MAG: hypothetical protein NC231_04825 [Bacillus sp. (in: Bacteria)]|nr:hypothetical protein [Bacillus sp. (in: firmicutes)]MCM1426440.1 hypothetical protein [Eubacterium sp.]
MSNNGLQDIGSMQMGTLSTTTSSNSGGKKPQKNGRQIPFKIIIPAAAVICVILLLVIILPTPLGKSKAKKACKEVVENMFTGDEEFFEKYYPEEFAEVLYEYYSINSETNKGAINEDDIKVDAEVKSVTPINVKKNKTTLRKRVKEYFEEVLEEVDVSDMKISKAYLVKVKMDINYSDESEKDTVSALVLKIDGKYGVYFFCEDFDKELDF